MVFLSKSIPADLVAKEREIAQSQATADPKNANKPQNIIDKMVEGRLEKFYGESVLLEQPFVRDQTITVGELVTKLSAETGEKIQIRRFTRFKLGEGLEKRSEDFGSEVAAALK